MRPIRSACAVLLVSALAVPALAATAPGRTIVVPPGAESEYDDWHYAPAIRVGDTVILSGIPGRRGDPGTPPYQRLFERARQLLEASGATLADVVELNSFHTDVSDHVSFRAAFKDFSAAHATHFKGGYPAWTAVGTTALLAEGATVELRVMAVIGSGAKVTVQRQDR